MSRDIEWAMTPERVKEAGPARGLRPGWRLVISGLRWERSVLLAAADKAQAAVEAVDWMIAHPMEGARSFDLIWR